MSAQCEMQAAARVARQVPSHCCCSASQFINLTDVSVPPDLKLKSAEKKVKRD